MPVNGGACPTGSLGIDGRLTTVATPDTLPVGAASGLAGLFMIPGWAGFHDPRLVIDPDHAGEAAVFEKALTVSRPEGSFRNWRMWRAAANLTAQTAGGRMIRLASVADAPTD